MTAAKRSINTPLPKIIGIVSGILFVELFQKPVFLEKANKVRKPQNLNDADSI